jgi:hypothetical protein
MGEDGESFEFDYDAFLERINIASQRGDAGAQNPMLPDDPDLHPSVCQDEVIPLADGGEHKIFRQDLCGRCVTVKEEEWAMKNISPPENPSLYLKRVIESSYECFPEDDDPPGEGYGVLHPLYLVRLETSVYHDSSGWCCGDDGYNRPVGTTGTRVLHQVQTFSFCRQTVLGQNENPDSFRIVPAGDELRRMNMIGYLPPDYEARCNTGTPCIASCEGDIEWVPVVENCNEVDGEYYARQEGDYCIQGWAPSESPCTLPPEGDGDDPFEDDGECTLHLFTFDGFQNPGVHRHWASALGSSRASNPDILIRWHLYQQKNVDMALARMVQLARQFPEDYFGVAGFSWGGHSAIKLARRAGRRGIRPVLGFTCDPVPHLATIGSLSKPTNVGPWLSLRQLAGDLVTRGRIVSGAYNEDVTFHYRDEPEPHMSLGWNCDDGKINSNLSQHLAFDVHLDGVLSELQCTL